MLFRSREGEEEEKRGEEEKKEKEEEKEELFPFLVWQRGKTI